MRYTTTIITSWLVLPLLAVGRVTKPKEDATSKRGCNYLSTLYPLLLPDANRLTPLSDVQIIVNMPDAQVLQQHGRHAHKPGMSTSDAVLRYLKEKLHRPQLTGCVPYNGQCLNTNECYDWVSGAIYCSEDDGPENLDICTCGAAKRQDCLIDD